MSIDASSTVATIFTETGYPQPSEDDLSAWNFIECGTHCGTPETEGYWYTQGGVFSFGAWDEFVEFCDTATTECSDVFETDDYDGWAVGLYMLNLDITTGDFADNEKLAWCFADYEFCFYIKTNLDTTWGKFSATTTEISEDYPAQDDLADANDYDGMDQYSFGHWYADEWGLAQDTEQFMSLWQFQAYDNADKFEVGDWLENIWIVSSEEDTNLEVEVQLMGATTLVATSAVVLAASFF